MRNIAFLFAFIFLLSYNSIAKDNSSIQFYPIEHASFVIQSGDITIFVDPVGAVEKYTNFPTPQLILLTHAHGDHLNKELIESVKKENTQIIGPAIVTQQLGYGKTMANGEKATVSNINIESVAMYNASPERLNFHPKGVGNGYVIELNGERIYIAGDTEDIPEMRKLKNIDHAFVCMNLPYTMTPEQAASAVLEFKPKHVYPYHYRQQDGFSNIDKFKELVSTEPTIKVELLKWY